MFQNKVIKVKERGLKTSNSLFYDNNRRILALRLTSSVYLHSLITFPTGKLDVLILNEGILSGFHSIAFMQYIIISNWYMIYILLRIRTPLDCFIDKYFLYRDNQRFL